VRLILALAAAAAVGALGALILGEYEFTGITILATGVIFGLFLAEAALAVNRRAAVGLGAGTGLIGLAAMTWGAWITTFHHLSVLPGTGWAAVVLTGAAAGLRAGIPRRADGTPAPAPAPAAASEEERP
jgi:hypothetical protein